MKAWNGIAAYAHPDIMWVIGKEMNIDEYECINIILFK